MKIKHALHTAALAITLAFAGAGQAADFNNDPLTYDTIWNFGGNVLGTGSFPGAIVTVYNMVNTDPTELQNYLAFCIQPTVHLGAGYSTNYTALDMRAQFGDNTSLVKALYETSYSSIFAKSDLYGLNANEMKQAFQLALWDAGNDDGDIYGNGKQSFVLDSDDAKDLRVLAANGMLTAAATAVSQEHFTSSYRYIAFNAPGEYGPGQMLMSVTAVPEADTWAMLAAGLGLIGFMGRRQSRRSETFSA